MENDKATAWLTLADADAVDKRVLDIIARALHGYNVDNMDNQKQLGMSLLMNFAVQNYLKDMMIPLIHNEIGNGLKNNLRIDYQTSQARQVAHYRISYGPTVVLEQAINLRGY